METTNQIKEYKSHFVEQLEYLGLELGTKLDQIGKEKKDYGLFKKIHDQLNESVLDFCSSYFSLSNEGKKELQRKLLNLFKDQEIVDNIIQEIINLYYLREAELLELEETRPQLEIALENLKTLSAKIEKYLSEIDLPSLEREENRLSNQLERVVAMGSTMEEDEDEEIEDIDFLEEMLETCSLPDEEKRGILEEIIRHNLAIYRGQKKKEPEDFVILQDVPTITQECRDQINELLSRREVVERIVRIVNDDYDSVIHMTGLTLEEQEQVDSSLELAREDIEENILANQGKTPEEALSEFFQKYDERERKKRILLNQVLEQEPVSSIPEEMQQQILDEAFDYEEKHLSLIGLLSQEDKNKIQQWMASIYQNEDNRKAIYASKAYTNPEEVEAQAAYEIQVMRDLMECISEEDKETYGKLANRMKTILENVKETIHTEERQEEKGGNIFYLTNDEGVSTLEEDLEPDHKSKGISASYYKEIESQIRAIQNRSEKTLVAAQPVNPGFKAIKKQGVRYTNSSRTKVFFIPVGKEDAIIVGASFITGKDTIKDQETKVKRYTPQIEMLKERLANPETYQEEVSKARSITDHLFRNRELDFMLQEEQKQEETVNQK